MHTNSDRWCVRVSKHLRHSNVPLETSSEILYNIHSPICQWIFFSNDFLSVVYVWHNAKSKGHSKIELTTQS